MKVIKLESEKPTNNVLLKQSYDDIVEILNYISALLTNEPKEINIEWESNSEILKNNIRTFLINNNLME